MHGTIEDAQNVIDKLYSTGEPILDAKGNWTNKERVESPEIIGTHINPENGTETETKKAIIVYSKTGSHVMPGRSDDNGA